MPRTLIFGTSYVATQERRWLCQQWHRLVCFYNSHADIRVIDSASPSLPTNMKVYRFPDNIGHLQGGGRDGWGRAFCKGIEFAIEEDFDWVVHIECDLLFAAPVFPIINKMQRTKVKVAAPIAHPFQWIETGLLFMNVKYLKSINFIARYDWPNSPQVPLPERRCEQIFEDHLFGLALKGLRNDLGLMRPATIKKMFPDGIHWATHCSTEASRAFLTMNGMAE